MRFFGQKAGGWRWMMSSLRLLALAILPPLAAGCSTLPELPLAPPVEPTFLAQDDYRIVPGDSLSIFVWQDKELSLDVRVRPDGRISMPLLDDVAAAGRTPAELGRELAEQLKTYVQDPRVTVIVADYVGPVDQQIRVVGEAAKPQSLPYRPNMSLLDVLIAVGGLTEFADGNRAILVRTVDDQPMRYAVRLADLLQHGDISANAKLLPGDVLIVPEAMF